MPLAAAGQLLVDDIDEDVELVPSGSSRFLPLGSLGLLFTGRVAPGACGVYPGLH
jgi:hypothetical protein